MPSPWLPALWVVYNQTTGKIYLRRSLFKVRFDHVLLGYL